MYKQIDATTIQRLEDSATIPLVEGNRDYEDFKQWVLKGNVPAAADPVAPETPPARSVEDRLVALELAVSKLVD